MFLSENKAPVEKTNISSKLFGRLFRKSKKHNVESVIFILLNQQKFESQLLIGCLLYFRLSVANQVAAGMAYLSQLANFESWLLIGCLLYATCGQSSCS